MFSIIETFCSVFLEAEEEEVPIIKLRVSPALVGKDVGAAVGATVGEVAAVAAVGAPVGAAVS